MQGGPRWYVSDGMSNTCSNDVMLTMAVFFMQLPTLFYGCLSIGMTTLSVSDLLLRTTKVTQPLQDHANKSPVLSFFTALIEPAVEGQQYGYGLPSDFMLFCSSCCLGFLVIVSHHILYFCAHVDRIERGQRTLHVSTGIAPCRPAQHGIALSCEP